MRDVGEVVCWRNSQASLSLFRPRGDIVDNVSTPRLHIVGFQVSDSRNVWVRRLAVVALVVVIGQDLPVIGPLHLPAMVENVVFEVKLLILFLFIGTEEIILPRDLGYSFSIKVDPDEAIAVDVYMNWQQTILGLVKACELLITWCLGQVAAQTVRPAMISEGQSCQYLV